MADLANKADKDFSNVTAPVQAFKNMSIGWGMSDYSAGVSVAVNTTHVATVDSFAIASATSNSQGSNSSVSITLKDSGGNTVIELANRYSVTGNVSSASVTIPVPKGYSITPTALNSGTCYIYPLKGAN